MVRFREALGSRFIPNPFCYVEVTDEEIVHRQWWRDVLKMRLPLVTAQLKPHGWYGKLFGYAAVYLKEESRGEATVNNLMRADQLYAHIMNRDKASKGSVETIEDATRKPPEGTIFTSSAVRFPAFPASLNSGLWNLHVNEWGYLNSRCPALRYRYGDWVNRGDILCEYRIRGSLFSPETSIGISSPVSGVLLQDPDPSHERSWGAILTPVGEPTPMRVSEALRSVIEYCAANPQKVFIHRSGDKRPAAEATKLLEDTMKTVAGSEIEFAGPNDKIHGQWTSSMLDFFEILEDLIEKRPYLREMLTKARKSGPFSEPELEHFHDEC